MTATPHPLGALAPLAAYRQFIVVMLVPKANGKIDKIPCDYRTGKTHVDSRDPQHWTDYATIAALVAHWGPRFCVGFVLTKNDPFFVVDIDGCREGDGWSPLAQTICAMLPGTAVEVSLSGNGLHAWGQGPVPPHTMKNVPLHLEMYDSLRFIALGQPGAIGDMTQPCPHIASLAQFYFPPRGNAADRDVPEEGPREDWRGPTDDDDLLRRAMRSQSANSTFNGGASFADLWTANEVVLAKAYPADASSSALFDHSSADMALANHLAFWTGCDVARINRLMLRSALAREKWDRDDYLVERTIKTACRTRTDVLKDKPTVTEQDRAAGALAPAPQAPAVAGPAGPSTAPGGASLITQAAMRKVDGEPFVSVAEQAEFFKGCIYVVGQHRVLVPGGELLKPDQFKAKWGGRIFILSNDNTKTTRNAWEAFTESQVLRCPQADNTCFRPDLPYGALVHDAGRVRANKYWPVETPRKKGDATRFLTHIAKLFPNPRDQIVTLSYMAACVQHVGYKFQWAPLFIGVEGNGKTLLSRCVAEAIGRRYVHWPKASKIAKDFNAWLADNVLYCVEDIYTKDGKTDVLEELKPMITGGDGIEIEKKGVDQMSAEICGNFIFNSNHKDAIKKTRNDRRFCVLYCAQQDVEDLARDGMGGTYLSDLYDWLKYEDGYAIVTDYLKSFEIPDEFNPAKGCQRAPITSSTEAAIEASLGPAEQEVLQAIEQERVGFRGGWVSSMALERLLRDANRSNAVPINKRRDMLRSLGYDWHPALTKGQVSHPVPPDGGKPKLFIKNGHPSREITAPAAAAAAYSAAQA